MANLGLKVSRENFQTRIDNVKQNMDALQAVIDRYNQAKNNLTQFIEEGDSNYQNMIDRIDENVKAAKKAHAALSETKVELEKDMAELEDTNTTIGDLLEDAKDAAKSVIEAAIKVDSIL